jgi:hypothetical protein
MRFYGYLYIKAIKTQEMEIERDELINLLQGHWQLENEGQNFEISGTDITVYSNGKTVKTSLELIRNLQLKNWQVKAKTHLSWLRTFIVDITGDSFMLYDFEPTVAMAMGGRSRLLNPSRIFRYSRVVEGIRKQPVSASA